MLPPSPHVGADALSECADANRDTKTCRGDRTELNSALIKFN